MTTQFHSARFVLAAFVSFAVGCAPAPVPVSNSTPKPSADKSDHGHSHDGEGHSHGAGPHQGTIADWGGGKFHVEFLVDHGKQEATVYILGGDEKTPTPIKATDGKLLLTINEPKFQTDLLAQPLDGETDGMSSRFVGQHEKFGVEQEFSGTISAEVEGTPYEGDFKEEAHDHK